MSYWVEMNLDRTTQPYRDVIESELNLSVSPHVGTPRLHHADVMLHNIM